MTTQPDAPQDKPQDELSLTARVEPLTPEEIEGYLARVRAEGRALTSEEQYALFGPPRERKMTAPAAATIEGMEAAFLDSGQLARLQADFFPELPTTSHPPQPRLVQGIIFDFDDTLAYLSRPLDDLMVEGAKAALAYMQGSGMTLPDNFWEQIVEARRFAQHKSAEEKEEHLADDAMSFLLQFYGYPASRLDPQVLRRVVDIFYAPEMTAWRLHPHVVETLQALQQANYKLALLTNYNCDRIFQRIVDYLGIRPYFDLCLTSASVEYRKPDPQFFNLVLTRWDALPYEIVVVGDSLRDDIQGGIDLGALTVQVHLGASAQVLHDNRRLANQVKPDALIEDWIKLSAQIEIWAGVG